jgi:amino acid adenylation domain-containing protein/non-ribosomal peptide synthase protein (TIGR01720 family)
MSKISRARALLSKLSPGEQESLEKRMKGSPHGSSEGIPQRTPGKAVPLSSGQRRLWFLERYEPDNTAYNESFAIRLTGPLKIELLSRGLGRIVERHQILRTTFSSSNGTPFQVIHDSSDLTPSVFDVSTLPQTERVSAATDLIETAIGQPFDLSSGPLLRVGVYKLDEEDHVLAVTMHHIITDAWSIGVLAQELTILYTAFHKGVDDPVMPELPIQYGDFATWEHDTDVAESGLEYWRQQLCGAPVVLELPTDRMRPPVQRSRGSLETFEIPVALKTDLERLSERTQTTLYLTLLATFACLLHRYSGSTDLLIGTPVANRSRREIEPLIGFFVNTVVLRAKFAGDPKFSELLKQMNHTSLDALEHQSTPFEAVVEAIKPRRDASYNPLFQVMFALENTPNSGLTLPGLTTSSFSLGKQASYFDLSLQFEQDKHGLSGAFNYNTDLFDQATMKRMIRHYLVLLADVVDKPEQRISQIPLLTATERNRLLCEWNDTTSGGLRDDGIGRLFETQVEAAPDSIALTFKSEDLTYLQLHRRVNRLARHLRNLGVGPDVRVAVYMPRTPAIVVALLGILKAGGAYVPVDPAYPEERLKFILRDSQAGLVLTLKPNRSKLLSYAEIDPESILCLDNLDSGDCSTLPSISSPNDLAYMIYTSGSTGNPKAAMVEHKGMVNHLLAKVEDLDIGPHDRVVQNASQCFDISIWQFLAALLVGGTVHLVDDEVAHDPHRLFCVTSACKATILEVVPTVLGAFLDGLQRRERTDLEALRWLVPTGEALPPEMCRDWLRHYPEIPLINAYGPTECSDDVTHYVIEKPPVADVVNLPVGRPVRNTQMYILDPRLEPVAVGISGQLWVGGRGVGRGYLGRVDLTSQSFVPNPFGTPGSRLYKTGDRARYLPDGNIEFLGRIDHQLKIRGFRIEPGEIEAVLTEHPEVRDAVVVARKLPSGANTLVAYVASGAAGEELKGYLASRLPGHMVPSTMMTLDSLPLTPNGKVDRKALPAPEEARVEKEIALPRNEVEQVLCDIWKNVLGRSEVGIHENFFELGGDSIISIQVVSRAIEAGIQLTARMMVEHQSIARLAAAWVEPAVVENSQPLPDSFPSKAPLTPIQRWFFQTQTVDIHHYNQAVLLEVPTTLKADLLEQAVIAMVNHHDALRLRFTKSGTSWTQETANREESKFFSREELSPAACKDIQASLNLTHGPLLRAVLSAEGDRLLLVIHHLAVDGVSWRILLSDLFLAYRQLQETGQVSLPSQGTSFTEWAHRLSAYAHTAELDWPRMQTAAEIPCDSSDPSANTVESSRTVSFTLSQEQTTRLLRDVPPVYHAQINDVLLTGLGLALKKWTGGTRFRIDLEGHGREELLPGLDLSRTVGWFTSLYPVDLDLTRSSGPGSALKSVKESLRAIPDHGLGYGILRYLCGAEPEEPARVSFNYLGQLDSAFRDEEFRLSGEPTGPAVSPRAERPYWLDISGLVKDGQLEMSLCYSTALHRPDNIERLAGLLKASLTEIVEHCLSTGAGGYTPSDFPLAGLSQFQLDTLFTDSRAVADVYPLTPMQQGMLFHTLQKPGSGVYFEQQSCRLEGPLNSTLFRQAWHSLVQQHEVLRTYFVWESLDEPLQVVVPSVDLPWSELDWRHLDPASQEKRLSSLRAESRRTGLELSTPPVMRFHLLRLSEHGWHFLWEYHHVLLDGWCLPLLFGEVLERYDSLLQGLTETPPSPRPYRAYVEWLTQQDRAPVERFWRSELENFTTPTPLPSSGHTGGGMGYSQKVLSLPEELNDGLKAFCKRERVTLNTMFQAAWALLLGRYGGESDVVFGQTVSGRPAELSGVEDMVGLFINTIPVRVDVCEQATLSDWLRNLQAHHAQREQYSYTSLIEVSGWSEVAAGVNLFDSILVFENYPVDEALREPKAGLEVREVKAFEQTNYPLTVVVMPGRQLNLTVAYDRGRFSPAVIERLLSHFHVLLSGMVARPRSVISELPILSVAEVHRQVVTWNDTSTHDFLGKTVVALFSEQVRKDPGKLALVFGDEQYTYDDLNTRSNGLAHYLRFRGVVPGTTVALGVHRSPAMVEAFLGILKAGGTYLPLDLANPDERIKFMLEDSTAKHLLTLRECEPLAGKCDLAVTYLDDPEVFECRDEIRSHEFSTWPNSPAYIIYTSGSSGQPKGVIVSHRGLGNLAQAQANSYGIDSDSRVLQLASPAFDVSVGDMVMTLCSGATLYPAEPEQILPGGPEEHLLQIGTHLQIPPSVLGSFPAEACSLECVIVGGEPCPPDLVSTWSDRRRFFNAYGPTEATICATVYERPQTGSEGLAIGRPIANTKVYLLDPNLREVPLGAPGEVCLAGVGLAFGYLGQAALTAESFSCSPFPGNPPGARLYRTGDLARYLPDGNLEFLGRKDDQIKIMGFRVAPGEIESALRQNENVKEAVVLLAQPQALVAFVVLEKAAPPNESELRQHLTGLLPKYMIPTGFVVMDSLPLLPSGKVDRKKLSAGAATTPQPEYVPPRSPSEEMMTGLWSQVLGLERVGIHDNFFAIGGQSLLATRVTSGIRDLFSRELPLSEIFESPTVAALCGKLVGFERTSLPPVLPSEADGPVPLSFAQERMWFLDQLEEDRSPFTITSVVRLEGSLDPVALERSLTEIVRRHEALRTRFVLTDGELRQKVLRLEDELLWENIYRYHNLAASVCPLSEARRRVAVDAALPFDLASGSVLRVRLFGLREREFVLSVQMHHIVSDGWSMGIFIGELSSLYRAYVEGRPSPLPEVRLQYADFAIWQRGWLEGRLLADQLDWWKNHLEGAPPLLELPTDRSRPRVQSSEGSTERFELTPELTGQLKELARQESATPFMVLQAALALLLSRYSGREDIVVGSLIANRNHSGVEPLIGYFINALPLRTDLSGDPSFRGLLTRVRTVALGAFENQDIPFEYLVEELQPERSLNHAPLFQVMLIFQNLEEESLELPGMTVEPMELESAGSQIDMTLAMGEQDGRYVGQWEFSTDLFDPATIRRMAGHLSNLLEATLADPDRRLSELTLLSKPERRRLLIDWNDSGRDYPNDRTVVEVFGEQCRGTPDSIALVHGKEQLTYAELAVRSDRVAGCLAARGIGTEDIVALCADRSAEMLVGFLGTLKVGAVYVPLDPAYPEERLKFILGDSNAKLLLTQKRYEASMIGYQMIEPDSILCLDDLGGRPLSDWTSGPNPELLAYMIYTSGSTGKPKAAMVEHQGMLNHLFAKIYDLGIGPNDRVVQNASQCFDISIWQFLAALLVGGTVQIVDDDVAHDPPRLFQLTADCEVAILEVVPSVLGTFLSELPRTQRPDLQKLRWLVPTGEALPPEMCRDWLGHFPDIPLVNAYGPTECSDDVTHYVVDEPPHPGVVNMPVGRPIINIQMYVLDQNLEPVPVGVIGELFVGGDGVGRGYMGRVALTAKTFVPDPFGIPGGRLYRTGDLARYLPDANIEFLGRTDHQIKIRGFRIELGEIESALAEYPGVKESVVIAREDRPGVKQLVAYAVLSRSERDELWTHLRARLPEHMVPAALVELDSMPLTPNGKIDRKALPAPSADTAARQLVPRDVMELQLLQHWEEVLDVRPIGLEDNFFELGGHSLLAVRLMGHIQQTFGRQLPLSTLFQASTVKELAQVLREQSDQTWSSLVPIKPTGTSAPLFILPGTGGNVMYYYQLSAYLGAEQPVYGLQPPGLDGRKEPLKSIEELAAHHISVIKTVQHEGPYHLCGHSFGSYVAFEIAQQLLQAGEQIDLLALVDTPAPLEEYTDDPSLHDGWDEADWLALVASITGTLLNRQIDLSAETLRQLPAQEQLPELQRHLEKVGWLVPGSDTRQLRALVNVYKTNALTRYRPERIIPMKIDLFLASNGESQLLESEDWGWQRFAGGTVEVQIVPGTHISVMQEPNVRLLAAQLKRLLSTQSAFSTTS